MSSPVADVLDVPAALVGPVLAVEGISKAYAGVLAVDDVTMAVQPGEVLGLVGKNGAGKSTLIKILTGVVRRDTGTIRVEGAEASISEPWDAERLGIYCIHQELSVVGELSVAENIVLGNGWPRRRGLVDHKAVRARASELLARLGETGIDPDALVNTLSPARQRMVVIARALWSSPKVVILDEPTASLSVSEVKEVHALIRRLEAAGIAVVFVSHRLEEVLELCGAVAVMRDGVFEGRHDRAGLDMAGLVGLITGRTAAAGGDAVVAATLGVAAEDLEREEGWVGLEDEVESHVPTAARPLLQVRGMSGPGVHDVDLTVRPGEVLGLGGLVGAGRTELLRLIAGAAAPSEGSVEVSGQTIRSGSVPAAIESGVVLLPEDRKGEGVIGPFTVRQNLTLAALPGFRRRSWLPVPSARGERKAVEHYTESLGIKLPSEDALIGSLSGGNQQKVLLARWLVKGAAVFLCDEPTQGVDVDGKDDIGRQIRAIADAGNAVVLVSSDLPELVAWSDRVVVMREGRIAGELDREHLVLDSVIDLCFGTAHHQDSQLNTKETA